MALVTVVATDSSMATVSGTLAKNIEEKKVMERSEYDRDLEAGD
jgi:hypothetical protein